MMGRPGSAAARSGGLTAAAICACRIFPAAAASDRCDAPRLRVAVHLVEHVPHALCGAIRRHEKPSLASFVLAFASVLLRRTGRRHQDDAWAVHEVSSPLLDLDQTSVIRDTNRPQQTLRSSGECPPGRRPRPRWRPLEEASTMVTEPTGGSRRSRVVERRISCGSSLRLVFFDGHLDEGISRAHGFPSCRLMMSSSLARNQGASALVPARQQAGFRDPVAPLPCCEAWMAARRSRLVTQATRTGQMRVVSAPARP